MNQQILLQEELLKWALLISIGFPIIEILLGEIVEKLKKQKNPLVTSVQTLRNLVIPNLVVLLLIKNVLKLDENIFIVKIIETLFWVFLIVASLSLLNVILLAEQDKNSETWRSNIPKFFQDLSRFLLILIGTSVVLSVVWKIDLAGLITALGVGSIVIGLALQDTLGSIFTGIAMVFERPFKIGDWLVVGDIEGKVVDMNWRSVHLETREKYLVVIPHLIIGKDKIINYNQPNKLQKEYVTVGFGYEHPPNFVKQVLKSTAISSPGIVADPEPIIRTESYDDSSISYIIEFFIDDYDQRIDIRDELKTRVWYAAKRYNLNIPFPIRDVYLHQVNNQQENKAATKFTDNLHAIPSLVKMEQTSIENIANAALLHHFAAGEKVIKEGDKIDALHLMISGKVQVTSTNNRGQIEELFIIERGEFFGEISLFTGEPSPYTIIALEDLEVILIEADVANKMIERQPTLAREIGQIMEARRKAVNLVKGHH
jgi:small-conductance mechanosensitive channel